MPLSRYLKAFPPLSALHPFEAALLDLTVGAATYASVLGKADALRKSLQEVRGCTDNNVGKCLISEKHMFFAAYAALGVLGKADALRKSLQEVRGFIVAKPLTLRARPCVHDVMQPHMLRPVLLCGRWHLLLFCFDNGSCLSGHLLNYLPHI